MSFTGMTWYIRYNGTENVIEQLDELMEELEAQKLSAWKVEIKKYSNLKNNQFAIESPHEVFYIHDSNYGESTLV
jgi:ABC-type uncharacterized transport system substrate-binding protein